MFREKRHRRSCPDRHSGPTTEDERKARVLWQRQKTLATMPIELSINPCIFRSTGRRKGRLVLWLAAKITQSAKLEDKTGNARIVDTLKAERGKNGMTKKWRPMKRILQE